jgi:PQQ-dependent dehydrogenase (methanol/ethanol family)
MRLFLLILFIAGSEVQAAGPIAPAPAFKAKTLTAPPDDRWVTNGGNLYNQRYSPLTAIHRDNVRQVRAEWRTHLNRSGMKPQSSGQGQILFYAGTLYQVTGEDDVFALDVETGEILWTYAANLDPADVMVCCGWVSRGLGLGDGRLYVGRLDGKLVALDQRSGGVLWSIQAEDPRRGFSITAAPLYYNGMVIIGFAGGDMGIRGRLKAYDAKTGKLIWTFYTIPGPGEFGHDTWPADNDAWKYGGASIWQTPAVDPELGLIYFSTGNAAPDFNGAARAGDNLFTVSIVALDVRIGKYRWHFQQVHHDIWDYDSPSPVVLFDAEYNGVLRKGIAQIPKTGWVYVLDRTNGRPLLPIEERPVPQEHRQKTAATQPYVIGDAIVPQSIDIAPEGIELINEGRIFTPFWDQPVIYKPQMAVNWPPTSYDPRTNTLFICAIDNVGNSASDTREEFAPPGFEGMWLGSGGFARHGIAGRGILGRWI